jgi:Zn-dependent protease with chaperone function
MSIAYRIGLVLVAIVMVLLPVLYCVLLAGVGWLVYWHAVTHVSWFNARSVGVMLYAGLLFGGVVLILFMLKPLFAPRGGQSPSHTIDTAKAPSLFKLISVISEKIDSPLPAEVALDCDVNASASFTGGLRGMLRNELTLTIGLPLVAGLTQRQLAGVIAHELGHFRQGGARRLKYIVGSINEWFARVVYERDEWDERLQEAYDSVHGHAALLFVLAKACVATGRGVLWVFMMLAHGVSCFLSRQMEYDADRCQADIAGSASFRATAKNIMGLAAASQFAWHRMMETYGHEPLPENLPMMIAELQARIPAEVASKLQNDIETEKTGVFSTHPSMGDRIRRAEAIAAPGLPFVERPASALLPDFDRLSQEVTVTEYSMLPPLSMIQSEVDAMRHL